MKVFLHSPFQILYFTFLYSQYGTGAVHSVYSIWGENDGWGRREDGEGEGEGGGAPKTSFPHPILGMGQKIIWTISTPLFAPNWV